MLDKWEKSAWAQRRKAIAARRATSDFDRFEIMLLKKQRRRLVQVSNAVLVWDRRGRKGGAGGWRRTVARSRTRERDQNADPTS